ncbi:MAG: CBS domain-containing protein [Candidatus Methanoperedens sp.]|nr:CBS domain-containing protein [Candidatus Methanoperedens sp.]
MITSFQIGKIMGIPIKLHITFLLIIPVMGYIFANNIPVFGFSDVDSFFLRYALGISVAILLFTSVLLHELGHSFVALKHGTNIQGITLFLFGGVSSLEEIPRNPKVEFKMALAGPSVSLLIWSVLTIFIKLLNADTIMNTTTPLNPVLRVVWLIGYINIVLFIFNLIPAFPMDGGRVLRAVLAERMSYKKATSTAANVGKMFAIFMGIIGLIIPGGLWYILIAFFIYIGASEEDKSTQISVTLEGLKIRDIMTRDIKTVPSGMTADELVELMFRFKHMGYPVVEGDEVIGIVTFNDVQNIPKEERKKVLISDIMTKEIINLKEDDEAVKALKIMTINNIGRIIILNEKKMTGIVTRTDLLRSVQLLE